MQFPAVLIGKSEQPHGDPQEKFILTFDIAKLGAFQIKATPEQAAELPFVYPHEATDEKPAGGGDYTVHILPKDAKLITEADFQTALDKISEQAQTIAKLEAEAAAKSGNSTSGPTAVPANPGAPATPSPAGTSAPQVSGATGSGALGAGAANTDTKSEAKGS
jgi:hypothetical protein